MKYKSLTWVREMLVSKYFLIGVGSLVLIFIAANTASFIYYKDKTLPGTVVNNRKFSSVRFSELAHELDSSDVLPKTLQLSYKDKDSQISPVDLGIGLDDKKIEAYSRQHRSWLPVSNLFSTNRIPIFVKTDNAKYGQGFAKLAQTYKLDPSNSRIVRENGSFNLENEVNGYKLQEPSVRAAVVSTLTQGKNKVSLPAQIVAPSVKRQDLEPTLQELQKQQKLSVIFRYGSKNVKLTQQDIVNLYEPKGEIYVLSYPLIRAKVNAIGGAFGIRIQNLSEAVNSTGSAISHAEDQDFQLVPITVSRAFTYCVQLKGVDISKQAEFENKLRAVYADGRGWGLGGKVTFTQVNSGCNLRVWLAAADQLPAFGAICDSAWSCTVSPNVIINYDRWSGASDAWNKAGGNLEDYRSMVINHETGHWLGFGHRSCGGSGQPAPVMQQQSIDLQGCVFNPWPLPAELSNLRSWYGI